MKPFEPLCVRVDRMLMSHSWLLTHLNDFFVDDCWGQTPREWQEYLLKLDWPSLASLPSLSAAADTAADSVPAPPPSLSEFLSQTRHLAQLCARQPSAPTLPPGTFGDRLRSILDEYDATDSGCHCARSGSLTPFARCSRCPPRVRGMARKKEHEVACLAPVVMAVAAAAACTRVVDIGCGQGYLDRELARRGLDVLGVEAAAHNTKVAQGAASSDASAITSGVAALSATECTECATEFATKCAAEFATRCVAEDAGRMRFVVESLRGDAEAPHRMSALLQSMWPDLLQPPPPKRRLLMCALHACGDLTPTLLRCFGESRECAALVAVPCCYNLLTVHDEEARAIKRRQHADTDAADAAAGFVPAIALSAAPVAGFPLSTAPLRSTMPHSARMVACQREAAGLPPSWLPRGQRSWAHHSEERGGATEQAVPPGEALPQPLAAQLMRCLLEALVREHYSDLVPSGQRLPSGSGGGKKLERLHASTATPASFASFAQLALARASMPERLTETQLSSFAASQCGWKRPPPESGAGEVSVRVSERVAQQQQLALLDAGRRLAAFISLRAALAPLAEGLFLSDALLSLEQRDCEVALVPLFDAELSPRNVAIVAIKHGMQCQA